MSDLVDVSDPHGAGRGDRRRALRLVDEAYAAGRISAVDRGLRVEQVEAASTRGDLAMVVRDLVRPETPPQAVDPSAAAQPGSDSAAAAWPPPGYAGREVGPADVTSGPSRRTVGCIVAVVAVFFLLPMIIGMIALVVGLALGTTSP